MYYGYYGRRRPYANRYGCGCGGDYYPDFFGYDGYPGGYRYRGSGRRCGCGYGRRYDYYDGYRYGWGW